MDPITKQSVIDRLGQSNSILVTVKASPSIDELASCIGLTLFLNKIGKHATAVFSGEVPSVLEFLKPDDTIYDNTDSLRDFIISLDKSRADKLRYKVEDKLVRIFITPYKTALSEKDLNFSQGEVNVDVILALGVQSQSDIDKAVSAHGRILHDATIISVNNTDGGEVGTLNLSDPSASSLSEILTGLCDELKPGSFDEQIATAFLSGIVAATDRFSSTKTNSNTMALSAKLMAAGANQQLIATKLEPQDVAGGVSLNKSAKNGAVDGTLNIDHNPEEPVSLPEPVDTLAGMVGDVKNQSSEASELSAPTVAETPVVNTRPLAPPSMGGTLTANTKSPSYEPPVDPLSTGQTGPTLEHGKPKLTDTDMSRRTLEEVEKSVHSSHLSDSGAASSASGDLDAARKAIEEISANPSQSIGSGLPKIDGDVHGVPETPSVEQPTQEGTPSSAIMENQNTEPLSASSDNQKNEPSGPPPPVPPPLMPPS